MSFQALRNPARLVLNFLLVRYKYRSYCNTFDSVQNTLQFSNIFPTSNHIESSVFVSSCLNYQRSPSACHNDHQTLPSDGTYQGKSPQFSGRGERFEGSRCPPCSNTNTRWSVGSGDNSYRREPPRSCFLSPAFSASRRKPRWSRCTHHGKGARFRSRGQVSRYVNDR